MNNPGVYFIYGLCVMFFFMMTWLFWRKGDDRLSRLVTVLMLTVACEYIKDLPFIGNESYLGNYLWSVMASVDMIVVPLYGFILTELCRPGILTLKQMAIHLAPFVILSALLIITDVTMFYYIEVVWAGMYGTFYVVWTLRAIPRYNKILKENFSYSENIDLSWLRTIMFSFFIILGLWIVDCIVISPYIECFYMLGSLTIWIFICYFIYKHETIINELRPVSEEEATSVSGTASIENIVTDLFVTQKLYLNPKLKLTDVAQLVGTNRTYLSNFFNRTAGSTFYDYVNALRLDHAEKLLSETSDPQAVIAEKSGFNSLSTFRRAFEQRHNCSPTQYRERIRSY